MARYAGLRLNVFSRTDGQAELTWVVGYIHTEMVSRLLAVSASYPCRLQEGTVQWNLK